MARPPQAQVITANDLLSGEAVWLTGAGDWSTDPKDARILGEEAESVLASLGGDEARVVGPYLAPVTETGAPAHFRELFRTRGPSNRPDLGKQAEV